MWRVRLLFCFALLLANDPALAQIYKCTDARGTIVYSDDPTKMPRDCIADQAVELPQLNVIPAQSTPPSSLETTGTQDARAGNQEQQGNEGESYNMLNSQALDLIERYNAARRKATFAPLFRDKEAGKNALNEIQSEKQNLIHEIENSPMQQAQKNDLLEKLSQVPE